MKYGKIVTVCDDQHFRVAKTDIRMRAARCFCAADDPSGQKMGQPAVYAYNLTG
jgi:hypothetical protein